MKRVIIFDLDGLLVNTEKLFFRATKKVLKDEGIIVKEKDYIESDIQKGNSLLDVVQKSNHALDVENVRRRIYQTYQDLLERQKSRLFLPGALGLIERLKPYFTLAIASSSKREYAETILGEVGVLNNFVAVVCREDVKKLKPFPDCFLEVVRRIGVCPDSCLVIEDSRRGLEAAKKAGIQCIIVPNSFTRGYDYSDADLTLDSLDEVNKKVLEDLFNKKPPKYSSGNTKEGVPPSQEYPYVAIAAFLPPRLAKQIIHFSLDLATKFKSWYVLDTIKFPPHVTIWIAYVPTKNLAKIREQARKTIAQSSGFSLRIIGKHIDKSGYIAFKICKSKSIDALHYTLLEKLNKWREGYFHPKYIQNYENYPKEQQESLKRFGTRFTGSLFDSHITVAVVDPQYLNKVRQFLPKINKSFKIRELVLFRQVEPGKSVEILDRFGFRN